MKTIDLQKFLNWSKSKNVVIVILLIIVFLGGILRLYHLGANPLVADEFLDMNSSYGYFKTHIWQAWDFNMDAPSNIDVYAARDERAWPYKWQVAQLFRFFPSTEAAARSLSVIWGLISVFAVYWAAKSFTKKKSIGLLGAFLFAVSATAIAFDRKLRMYAMFYPMFLLMSLFLFQFLEADYHGKIRLVKFFYDKFKINVLFLVPFLVTALIGISIQLLSVNILPVFLVYILIQAIISARRKDYVNKYSIILGLSIIAAIAAFITVPQIIVYYSGVLKFFINNHGYLTDILRDYSNYPLAIILLISGIYFLRQQKLSRESWWLSLSFFVPLLMAAFMWQRTQGIQYVFFLQSFLIILIATGIYFWALYLRNRLVKFPQKAFYTVIILALLILPDYGYFFRNDTTYQRGNNQIADYRKVFKYVKKNLKPGDVLLTRNFRNYYFSGAKVKVFDFGGERATHDLSVADIQQIQNQNPHGWVVLFDNDEDFINKEAINYIKQNFTQVDNSQVRGASDAYTW
ncbi:MAG: glycosyltransferase family 39 protein [Parcubacteria group bacterium]|jgi:hypothetical protein